MITIIAKFDVIPSHIEEFTKCVINCVRETKKERGCLSYKFFQNRRDKSQFTFIEEWLNDTAIEQHNNAPHFKRFLEEIRHLTNGDVQIEQLEKPPSVFQ